MTDEVKACAACKWFKGPENAYVAQMTMQREEAQCEHPNAASKDLIYGKTFCRTERQTSRGCGKKGKLWVSQKPAPKP